MTLDQATDKILRRIVNPTQVDYAYDSKELSEQLTIPIETVTLVGQRLLAMNFISLSSSGNRRHIMYPKLLARLFVSEGKTFEDKPHPPPFLDNRPNTYPSTEATTEATKTGTKTSLGKFIIKHIVPIVVTILTSLLVAYLVYLFGWI